MVNSSDIESYYDEFSKKVLLKDFSSLNLRQEAIKHLCDRFIPNNAKVLEVGCGAGIISKHIQKRASHVVALDISDVNIKAAKAYAGSPKCDFKRVDITGDMTELKPYGKFEVIILPDVIEHIPRQEHSHLFSIIEKLLSINGLVLVTFPSPEYQEHNKKYAPSILQVVDETLTISDVLASTSLKPLYFSYLDVWGKNQYIHLVLAPEIDYKPMVLKLSVPRKIAYKIKNMLWHYSNMMYLRRIKDVL